MFALQVAMSGLPNLEPVSLLVMVYAVVFGKKCLYPIYVFVVMDILFFGIQMWNINYLYVWTVLALASLWLRDLKHPLAWAILGAVFGLLFGGGKVGCLPSVAHASGSCGKSDSDQCGGHDQRLQRRQDHRKYSVRSFLRRLSRIGLPPANFQSRKASAACVFAPAL